MTSQGLCVTLGFSPPPQSPAFLIQDREGGEQFIQKNVLPFSAASLGHRGHPPLPFMSPAALPMAGPSRYLKITQEIVQKPQQVKSCLGGTHGSASKTTRPSLCHRIANLEASAWWGLKKSRREGTHQEEGARRDERGGGLRSADGLCPAGSRYLLGEFLRVAGETSTPSPAELVTKQKALRFIFKWKIILPFL